MHAVDAEALSFGPPAFLFKLPQSPLIVVSSSYAHHLALFLFFLRPASGAILMRLEDGRISSVDWLVPMTGLSDVFLIFFLFLRVAKLLFLTV